MAELSDQVLIVVTAKLIENIQAAVVMTGVLEDLIEEVDVGEGLPTTAELQEKLLAYELSEGLRSMEITSDLIAVRAWEA
jgi:hypothetical protein